jgi:hypothetical protein
MAIKTASGSDLRNSLSSGLVLLNTTSFSGVSSQSFNDVFSATYTNYKILIQISSSGTGAFQMRLRVSGADNTNSDYNYQRLVAQSTSISGVRSTSSSSFDLGFCTNNMNRTSVELFNPFETSTTTGNAICGASLNNSPELDFYVFGTDVTTSYTGFTIFPASGTITGTVSVYGFNK